MPAPMPVLWVGEEGVHARNPLDVAEMFLSREASDRFTERKDSDYSMKMTIASCFQQMLETPLEDLTHTGHGGRQRASTLRHKGGFM